MVNALSEPKTLQWAVSVLLLYLPSLLKKNSPLANAVSLLSPHVERGKNIVESSLHIYSSLILSSWPHEVSLHPSL